MTSPRRPDLVRVYRRLFTSALRAVQYSKPARYVCRDRIRDAFRNSPAEAFVPTKVDRTLAFLNNAAKHKGLEHRIVKHLMFVWWEQAKLMRRPYRKDISPLRKTVYDGFGRSVAKLNESMGMCI
ncbi:hypothetical protein D0860_07249 [Hortaea werneckii]|uniref:DUF1763-domain-containing protein n=1 Tax=Hortaea werneckii TaxID=91943 RepID=A0A3M7GM74_HORWE|nr:hypothetical protein D0860_07249 [Hortaea werneckii]